MKFFSRREEDNIRLQIAWNAATVGLNPTRIKKGLLKRNTIMLYDISKSCKLIDRSEQEYMSLKTRAQLLCGISKIMRQKTSFLYEDTLHLCSRLQSALAVSPARTDHIDLQRPIVNLGLITLKNSDDLLEYQNSKEHEPFSDLFEFSSCIGNPDFYDQKLYNENIDSMLQLTNSLSIDMPYIESNMFMPSNHAEINIPSINNDDSTHFQQDHSNNNNTTDLFNDLDLDYGVDMDIDNIYQEEEEGVDFTEAVSLGAQSNNNNNNELTTSGHMEDNNIFEFPNPMHDIIEEEQFQFGAKFPATSLSSPRTSKSTTTTTRSSISGGHVRNASSGDIPSLLPPLIAEEDEYEDETSFSSLSTDMYSNMIEISPIPPEPHRPRIVQRMMLRREQDTVLPWSFYTNTENILRSSIHEQNKRQAKKEKQDLIQKELSYPSIAFSHINNPHLKRQKELAFSIKEDERYRFYFPHNYSRETNTEHTRNQRIEVSRRADHRRYSSSGSTRSGTSGSGGITHIRSSSEVTNSLEMQNIDLADIDMQDAEIRRNLVEEPNHFEGASSHYLDAQFDYDDGDMIDYDYFNFEDNNNLFSSAGALPKEQDDELKCNEFLTELGTTCRQKGNVTEKFNLTELFQLKTRSERAKDFYFLLELASKTKIRLYQKEAFGIIEVQLI